MFLTTYYARYQIVPIDDSGQQAQIEEPPKVPAQANDDTDDVDEALKQVDEPKVPNAVVNRMPLRLQPEQLRHQDLEQILEGGGGSLQKMNDFKLSIMLIFGAFASFGVLYIYFNYFRRMGGKSKKHIIWLVTYLKKIVCC